MKLEPGISFFYRIIQAILSWVSLVVCGFEDIDALLLSCQIYEYKVVHSITFLTHLMAVWSVDLKNPTVS